MLVIRAVLLLELVLIAILLVVIEIVFASRFYDWIDIVGIDCIFPVLARSILRSRTSFGLGLCTLIVS